MRSLLLNNKSAGFAPSKQDFLYCVVHSPCFFSDAENQSNKTYGTYCFVRHAVAELKAEL